jgi:hypothetical protein
MQVARNGDSITHPIVAMPRFDFPWHRGFPPLEVSYQLADTHGWHQGAGNELPEGALST